MQPVHDRATFGRRAAGGTAGAPVDPPGSPARTRDLVEISRAARSTALRTSSRVMSVVSSTVARVFGPSLPSPAVTFPYLFFGDGVATVESVGVHASTFKSRLKTGQ